MGIGVSILLIAIGAILAFALGGDELFNLGGTSVNMDTVGIILIVLGVVGLIMTLMIWGPRRRDADRDVVVRDREIR